MASALYSDDNTAKEQMEPVYLIGLIWHFMRSEDSI